MQKRLGTVQNFTPSASSQASERFGAQTYRVRVCAGSTVDSVGAWILFGDTTGMTVTSTNGSLLPTGSPEDFDVTPGQTFYTIGSSTNITVSLTELT